MMIYALRDPRTSKVVYIGRTIRPMMRRIVWMSRPKRTANKRINQWCRDLQRAKLRPVFEILEERVEFGDRYFREGYWIERLNPSLNIHRNNRINRCRQNKLKPEDAPHVATTRHRRSS